jgi:anti-sigma B factor antagonist
MILDLHATPRDVMRAVEALERLGQEKRVAEKELFGLALALEECASNIVNHAFHGDSRQTFRVVIEHTDSAITIELRDRGPEFDPTHARVPTLAAGDEDRPPGGWGIHLVRHYMDEIHYQRQANENVLRLTKRLGPAPGQESLCQSEPNHGKLKDTYIDMPLEIQIQKSVDPKSAGTVTVRLAGSLDTVTAPELERQLTPVLAGPVKDLVFDLADLRFISSVGLRVFATTRKHLKQLGGQTSFVRVQPQIQEVFDIMKALPGVAIFQDVAELDRYLAARQRSHLEGK